MKKKRKRLTGRTEGRCGWTVFAYPGIGDEVLWSRCDLRPPPPFPPPFPHHHQTTRGTTILFSPLALQHPSSRLNQPVTCTKHPPREPPPSTPSSLSCVLPPLHPILHPTTPPPLSSPHPNSPTKTENHHLANGTNMQLRFSVAHHRPSCCCCCSTGLHPTHPSRIRMMRCRRPLTTTPQTLGVPDRPRPGPARGREGPHTPHTKSKDWPGSLFHSPHLFSPRVTDKSTNNALLLTEPPKLRGPIPPSSSHHVVLSRLAFFHRPNFSLTQKDSLPPRIREHCTSAPHACPCLPWSPSPSPPLLPSSRSSSPLLLPPFLQSPPATKPHTIVVNTDVDDLPPQT